MRVHRRRRRKSTQAAASTKRRKSGAENMGEKGGVGSAEGEGEVIVLSDSEEKKHDDAMKNPTGAEVTPVHADTTPGHTRRTRSHPGSTPGYAESAWQKADVPGDVAMETNGDETRTEVEANQDPVHTPVDDRLTHSNQRNLERGGGQMPGEIPEKNPVENQGVKPIEAPGEIPKEKEQSLEMTPGDVSSPNKMKYLLPDAHCNYTGQQTESSSEDCPVHKPVCCNLEPTESQNLVPSSLASGTVVPQPLVVLDLHRTSGPTSGSFTPQMITETTEHARTGIEPDIKPENTQRNDAPSDDNHGSASTTVAAATNTRETTFQKLRERIMMNKLQKSNNSGDARRETRSPIRPSLYRKYPKRKSERNRKHVVKHMTSQHPEEGVHQEPKKEPHGPQPAQPVQVTHYLDNLVDMTDNSQRYYLQPLNQFIPSQPISIKSEDNGASQGLDSVKKGEVNGGKQNGEIDREKVKRNLKKEFGTEAEKNSASEEIKTETEGNRASEEAERMWLRKLKEEGVKEVKRTEGSTTTPGLNREYQNEYYKFIEGMGFGNQILGPEVSERTQELRPKDKEGAERKARELSEMMARHPLCLQQREIGEISREDQKGGVVYVPRLVPYIPTVMPVQGPGQGQGHREVQNKGEGEGQEQGHPKCKDERQGQSEKILGHDGNAAQPLIMPPQGHMYHPAVSMGHLTGQVQPGPEVNSGAPNSWTSGPGWMTSTHGAWDSGSEGHPHHGNRRKQNAPKRRKPKDNEGQLSSSEVPSPPVVPGYGSQLVPGNGPHLIPNNGVSGPKVGNPEQPYPMIPGPLGAQMHAGSGVPGSGMAYAYIAIPVSSLVPSTSDFNAHPLQVPGAAALTPSQIPQGMNSQKEATQTQANYEAMDLTRPKDRNSDFRNGNPKQSMQTVQHPSLPVNPFRPHSQSHTQRENCGARRQGPTWIPNQNQNDLKEAQEKENEHTKKTRPNELTTTHYTLETPSLTRGPPGFLSPEQLALNRSQSRESARVYPQMMTSPPDHDAIPASQLRGFLNQQGQLSWEPQPRGGHMVETLGTGHDAASPSNQHQKFMPLRIPLMEQSAVSETRGQKQLPVPAPSPSTPSGRKASQFIDLTDDNDDVEDVYSPYDNYEVTERMLKNKVATQHQHPVSLPVAPRQREDETLQEEQMRLMDNVTKLAELHCEVGELINESTTQLMDALGPSGGGNNEPNMVRNNNNNSEKRKRGGGGKTGRKLIKYDHKGRRIFKFHEYCPTKPRRIIISNNQSFT